MVIAIAVRDANFFFPEMVLVKTLICNTQYLCVWFSSSICSYRVLVVEYTRVSQMKTLNIYTFNGVQF